MAKAGDPCCKEPKCNFQPSSGGTSGSGTGTMVGSGSGSSSGSGSRSGIYI